MSIIDRISKRLDKSNVIKFSQSDPFKEKSNWIHSGSIELERNLGILGFPVGITEIRGDSKSGKTTLALMGMKYFQQQHPDGACVILSSEERDNKAYAKNIGIDTNNVLIVKSKFVDDLFFNLQVIIDETKKGWKEEKLNGKPKLYVFWDSLGGTNSRAELETFHKNVKLHSEAKEEKEIEYKNAKMGDFAKTAKSYMKALLGQIYQNDIVFVILNHIYDNMDGGHGKKSPGGKWIEFLPTLRLETVRIGWEKLDETDIGQHTKVKVEKNDFGGRKETTIEILLGYGLVLSKNDIEYAKSKGILKLEGAKKYSYLNGKLTWSTKREFYKNYQQKHKLLPVLHKQILMASQKDILASKNVDKDEE